MARQPPRPVKRPADLTPAQFQAGVDRSGTLVESLVLAGIGGAIGAIATYAVFDGFTTSTLGASFTQVVFHFQLSPNLIGQGVALALIVGLAGGLLPAIRAARMPIVAGLQG